MKLQTKRSIEHTY